VVVVVGRRRVVVGLGSLGLVVVVVVVELVDGATVVVGRGGRVVGIGICWAVRWAASTKRGVGAPRSCTPYEPSKRMRTCPPGGTSTGKPGR
jgi:hypothetical protein